MTPTHPTHASVGEVKERPILFSAPMVRALLAGTKTQTRRVVKPQPWQSSNGMWTEWAHKGVLITDQNTAWHPFVEGFPRALATPGLAHLYPYGQPGDRLWVREAWSANFPMLAYRADGSEQYFGESEHRDALRSLYDRQRGDWRPGIHMPRWASRIILLEVTGVRVERLQDISEADAITEGIEERANAGSDPARWRVYDRADHYTSDPVESYRSLWESINGAGSWEANPWVWVVEFARATSRPNEANHD